MDEMLCDELLQEIFTRLPSNSSSSSSSSSAAAAASESVSLVSKRWLHLYRTSKTSLSVRIDLHDDSVITVLPSLLRRYPFLSSLSLLSSSFDQTQNSSAATAFSDQVLSIVSLCCSNLKHLRFLVGPVSQSSLLSLSTFSSSVLTSVSLHLSRAVCFTWVARFPCLKELSVHVYCNNTSIDQIGWNCKSGSCSNHDPDLELGLESVSLSGIRPGDTGVSWLWKSCRKLKRLKLKRCGSIEDVASFGLCLKNLEEIELRTCRNIVDIVLPKLSENCESLNSVLVYDGGSREGLVQFMNNCRCNLQKLHLRLPLDLNDEHLKAIAMNFRCLSNLRLQSCCLVTGEALKSLSLTLSWSLEELSLVNCDVIERESGLLTTLGQHLRKLKKLELSYNEFLSDKEFVSMLGSCHSLIELKLRGCKKLSSSVLICVVKSCERLMSIDIVDCHGIETEAIEMFVVKSRRLKCIMVEENKISDTAMRWASTKCIDVIA